MSTQHVRIVRSSEAAGSFLCPEIDQAFERIRERAQEIFAQRTPEAPGSEFEDWLRAEREMFEVPRAEVEMAGEYCRVWFEVEMSAQRPLTILVEPGKVTAVGHRTDDGEMCLYRVVNLSEPVDPERVNVEARAGAGVRLVLLLAEPMEEEPDAVEEAAPKAMAAAASAGPVSCGRGGREFAA